MKSIWPRKIEATIGAMFTFLVGFVTTVGGVGAIYLASGTRNQVKVVVITIPLFCCELAFLFSLKDALEVAHYPFAPWFALTSRRWPLLLRPIVALWWLSQFVLGVAGAVLVENLLVLNAETWDVRIRRAVAMSAVSFTVAYSANLYALLTITSLGGSAKI